MSDNNVTRHIDISNNIDVCNNTMVCTHTPSKVAIPSTDYLSQCDSKHLCDEVNKDLNCNTFWSNHKVVKSPGDGHCFIHAAANSLNVNSTMPTPLDDVSVILKQLSDETMHNSNRYVDFIDGNGRGSLLQGLNEYVNNRRYDTSFGDLVPIIIANALSVSLLIIENNGSQFEVQLLECQYSKTDHPHVLMFLKTGLHYDSIVPIDDQSAGLPSIDKDCPNPSEPIDDDGDNDNDIPRPLQKSALNDAEPDDSNAKASPSVNSYELYDVSSLVNSINKPDLKIGCLNVRGLLGKIDEIRDLLRLTKFDIICLCETFIDCNVADDEISTQEYSVILRNRNRHGGGVLIYVKNGIKYTNITNLDTHVENVFY